MTDKEHFVEVQERLANRPKIIAAHKERMKQAGRRIWTSDNELHETSLPCPGCEPGPCTGRIGLPGSTIKAILGAIGITASASCGCERFCRKMNAWGWIGCMTVHLPEIVTWFMARAKERPDITVRSMTKMIVRHMRERKKQLTESK